MSTATRFVPRLDLSHPIHYKGWTPSDHHEIKHVRTFPELTQLARKIISQRQAMIDLICGAITSGGTGKKEENLYVYQRTIEIRADQGFNIFSVIPFEEKMFEFASAWRPLHPKQKYCWPILRVFYHGVMMTGKVQQFHFIPGWSSSVGARWENRQRKKLGIAKIMLPKWHVQTVLSELPQHSTQ